MKTQIDSLAITDNRWDAEKKTVLISGFCTSCSKGYIDLDAKEHFIECSCGRILKIMTI